MTKRSVNYLDNSSKASTKLMTFRNASILTLYHITLMKIFTHGDTAIAEVEPTLSTQYLMISLQNFKQKQMQAILIFRKLLIKLIIEFYSHYHIGFSSSVSFNGHFSSLINVYSSVPQVAIWAQSLFRNDLPSVRKYSEILLFADDIKIYKSLK